jgi:hypothetical protein
MKRTHLTIILLLICSISFAQKKKETKREEKFSIGGYGELLFQSMNYGPNLYATPKGSTKLNRQIMDMPRFVTEIKYKFTPSIEFCTEIEYEHGGTGGAMEMEFEEGGEYEMEIEKGGEVALEQFHITKRFSRALNLRAGHFILGIGQINQRHLPTQYLTTSRPEGETSLIPTTWHETGMEIFGTIKKFDYRVQVVNGLDASGFSSRYWASLARQTKYELVTATNLAYILRLEYKGINGLRFGGSAYIGNSAKNTQKPEIMNGLDGKVSIYSFHANYNFGNIIASAQYLRGTIGDYKEINSVNKRVSNKAQYPGTPVAEKASCYSTEIGYDIFALSKSLKGRLIPFVRYDYYNSMEGSESTADKRYQRDVYTYGLNYFPIPNVVIKADYSTRKIGKGNYNTENTFAVSIGFSGIFMKK